MPILYSRTPEKTRYVVPIRPMYGLEVCPYKVEQVVTHGFHTGLILEGCGIEEYEEVDFLDVKPVEGASVPKVNLSYPFVDAEGKLWHSSTVEKVIKHEPDSYFMKTRNSWYLVKVA